MTIESAHSTAYYELFKNQRGKVLPAFQGLSRYQYGQGFDNFLGGIMKSVFPVLLSGAKAFLGPLGNASLQGVSGREALKSTIRPIAAATLKSASKHIGSVFSSKKRIRTRQRQTDGGGSGSRRRKRRKKVTPPAVQLEKDYIRLEEDIESEGENELNYLVEIHHPINLFTICKI